MTMTPMRRVGALAATFALAAGTLAATATTASAAGPSGVVTGKIAQPGGAALAGTSLRFFQENDPSTDDDDFNRYVYTQDDGTFDYSIPAGTYEVTARDSCDIFDNVTSTFTVAANAENSLNPVLSVLSSPAPTFVCARVAPEVKGLAQVGVPLTVSAGSYSQGNVTVLGYRWFNDSGYIAGATGSAYVPTAGDISNSVGVEVKVANSTGASEQYYPTAEDEVKRGDYVFASGPSVVGLPILGKTLTASAGALAPGAALSYQWFRNGAPIAGATAATYRVAKADYQRKLSAVITYKTFGYATVVRTVDAAFAAKKSAKLSTKISAGKKKATVTVKVKPSASKKLKGKITISENGKVLKRVSIKSASTKVTVSGLKKGKHKLTIVYEGRKYAAGTTKSVRIKK